MTSNTPDPLQAHPAHSLLSTNAVDTVAPERTAQDLAPKLPRPKRPNYAQIHAQPLPVQVFPLPAFIPHNPLSIVRIAIAMISHSIWPPTSHVVVHKAYFSGETQSIHVTDPQSIRALWEQGFWGSGSLSRSEPRWLDQEKRKRGIQAMQTSEEVTQQRRKERRQFKLERARLEREAIEEQRRAEGKSLDVTEAITADEPLPNDQSEPLAHVPVGLQDSALDATPNPISLDSTNIGDPSFVDLPESVLPVIEEQEHLQLTLEEGFFLTYVLGALEIYKDTVLLPSFYLFRLYCANSVFPVLENVDSSLYRVYSSMESGGLLPATTPDIEPIAPENPFVLKYVVFHHFRSLGWVVRPGIKFAVDYLLYNRGPAFSHAEFAVMILPSYSHPYWSETSERIEECKKKESRDWWWLHRINRVQSLAHKTLVLVYVEIPPPWDHDPQGTGFKLDIGSVLKKYKVREFVLGRWTPNRHR